MATSTLRIVGQIEGLQSGVFDFDVTTTSSLGLPDFVTLASGANTITVPSTSYTHVLILPPSGNVQTLTLKGVSGDTGVALSVTKPVLLSLASVASFVITAGGTVTGVQVIWL